jgi:uncharacterized repeat protein (TIGR03803 family)
MKNFPTIFDYISSRMEAIMLFRYFRFAVSAGLMAAFSLSGSSQTVTPIYSFSGQNSSGDPQLVVPVQGEDGALFGTTYGPRAGDGSIFKASISKGASQLYTFDDEGDNPGAGLTLATNGYFYGTASTGGSSGDGVLFKISQSGTYTVLHNFAGGSDGAAPWAAPIEASDGNFYGTTLGTDGASTIYRYQTNGTFSTIYSFTQEMGQYVYAGLVQGSNGNLYGAAAEGGANGCGSLFEITTAGTLSWQYSFPCGSDGSYVYPVAALIQANDGNFYGTTFKGGNSLNFGTVFKLDQTGDVTTIYTFETLQGGGAPSGSLVQGTDGNLYGTTSGGGSSDNGTLFQLTTSGTYKLLYSMRQFSGESPMGGLMQDTNGEFYGTASSGGADGNGTIYKLDMGLSPFVAFVLPVGKVGQLAQILGQNFTGTTSVTFNGVPATSFSVKSGTYMTAVVPEGATTGLVVVTTPAGTLTSNVNFTIQQ